MEKSWDNRAKYASRVSDVFTVIAETHFHIDMDDLTKQRWSELMQLMRELDTRADEIGSTPMILAELESFEIFENRYPSLSPGNLSQDQSKRFVSRVATILKHGEHLAGAETDWRYLATRRSEAIEVARWFEDVVSEHVQVQPDFHEKFMPFFEQITTTLNYFDSARDLAKDYKEGILTIEPSAKMRSELFKRTIQGLIEMRKPVMHHEVVLPYAKACLLGYWSHHLKNKAKREEKRQLGTKGRD